METTRYDSLQAEDGLDRSVQRSFFRPFFLRNRRIRIASNCRQHVPGICSDAEIGNLISFLNSLSGNVSINGRVGIPERVPSGLELDQ